MTHDELQNNSSDTGTKVPMTHDELLAKIGQYQNSAEQDHIFDKEPYQALRAVVEQAQPMHYKFGERQGDDPFVDGWNLAMRLVIEAIKKELG